MGYTIKCIGEIEVYYINLRLRLLIFTFVKRCCQEAMSCSEELTSSFLMYHSTTFNIKVVMDMDYGPVIVS